MTWSTGTAYFGGDPGNPWDRGEVRQDHPGVAEAGRVLTTGGIRRADDRLGRPPNPGATFGDRGAGRSHRRALP